MEKTNFFSFKETQNDHGKFQSFSSLKPKMALENSNVIFSIETQNDYRDFDNKIWKSLMVVNLVFNYTHSWIIHFRVILIWMSCFCHTITDVLNMSFSRLDETLLIFFFNPLTPTPAATETLRISYTGENQP